MTTEVYVTAKTNIDWQKIKENWAKLDAEFQATHDQNFEQEVNIDGATGKGEIRKMEHGLGHQVDDGHFISIPCHWDYSHAVQTRKDVRKVMSDNGIRVTSHISY